MSAYASLSSVSHISSIVIIVTDKTQTLASGKINVPSFLLLTPFVVTASPLVKLVLAMFLLNHPTAVWRPGQYASINHLVPQERQVGYNKVTEIVDCG